ncbi:hypothetical protein ABEX25_14930 [Paenibacillus thiaminolyticus]|uniref:hypothetical protein n=1 Tax=Paenibacillus thiaminolyticus TaxID=49283 RepID=UPI003D2976F9
MRTPIECRIGSRSWIQRSSNRQDGVQAGDAHRREPASAGAGGFRNGDADGRRLMEPPMTV